MTLALTDPEVELRRAVAADLGYLSALAHDPSVEPFLAPGAGAQQRLGAVLSQTESDGEPSGLFVIDSAAGEPLGGLALQLVSRQSRICELTRLMVDPAVRRAGVAAAHVRLACRRTLGGH